jgi:plasmid stabilization system protein ParE/Arc/MetJ-type ribon-helix-helix transcriptional regulator
VTRLIIVLPSARADVRNQVACLSQENQDVAERFASAVEDTCRRLAEGPDLGEKLPTSKRRLRNVQIWRVDGFRNHLVFYRPSSDRIEIVRVLHAARDWQHLLGE